MYAVLGITGNTGAAAAAALLDAGQEVRALVRDPDKAASWRRRGVELQTGGVEEAGSLRALFTGVAGAFALVPPQPAHPHPIAWYAQVAEAIRDAATASGLPRLVFLSSEGAHLPSGTGPIRGAHEGERILQDLPATRVTVLRPTYFQENWASVLGLATAQGILPTFLADVDKRRAMVATRDIGATAAALLLDPDPPALVELEGPEPYSARDAAALAGHAAGREVTPVVVPRDAWVDTLTGAGLGRPYAELLAEMYDSINAGHVRRSGAGELRRGPTPLGETIAALIPAEAA
jgi:uncharacterized protein YbjT (DUF2867 family)